MCTGAFIAAAAGLLDARRVTTHWAAAQELQAEYPALDVDPDPLYIRDGQVWTSAGVTAGIDLALAMVADDLGTDATQTLARWLVMFCTGQAARPSSPRRSGCPGPSTMPSGPSRTASSPRPAMTTACPRSLPRRP